MSELKATLDVVEPNKVRLVVSEIENSGREIQAELVIEDEQLRTETYDQVFFIAEEINGGLHGWAIGEADLTEDKLLEILTVCRYHATSVIATNKIREEFNKQAD